MLTWLKSRPATTRKAARPAKMMNDATKKRPAPPIVEEDMPPPFFADDDTAFLDMGDVGASGQPVVANEPAVAVSQQKTTTETLPAARLVQAVLDLPPFPERSAYNRMGQLLDIYRSLDRIAGEACDGAAAASNNR